MKLEDILKNIADKRILVIGDLMLDHYIFGDVHRISPEAPVPVVHVGSDIYKAGGAANVALNLNNLGIETHLIGYYGNDDGGQTLKGILQENKVALWKFESPSDASTIIKTRVVVRSQQICRIDREHSQAEYRLDTLPDFSAVLKSAMELSDAVIVSDYAKGVVTQALIDEVLTIAKSIPGLLVAIDPKPVRMLSFRGVGLTTPNRSEALALACLPEPALGESYPIEQVCSRIHAIYNPELLVVTLGADGMVISQEGKVLEHLPTVARQVYDVSGAGDTVIATLTAALAAGLSARQAVRLANAAAGCVVAHVGTVPVELEELRDWLEKEEFTAQTAYLAV